MTSPAGWSMAVVASVAAGCGGQAQSSPGPEADAGSLVYGLLPSDASAGMPVDHAHAWDRLKPHGGRVIGSVDLVIVYLADAAELPSVDGMVASLFTSAYWATMQQYGVTGGKLVGSTRVAATTFFGPGTVQGGVVAQTDVDARVRALLHGGSGAPPPPGTGYLVFLPTGVNVTLGSRGDHVYQTCIDVTGYHAFDGAEPYAVVGDCPGSPSATAISHELAELVTNPVAGEGWFSDDDLGDGGEICDLCDREGPVVADGLPVARLWSNVDGECMPR